MFSSYAFDSTSWFSIQRQMKILNMVLKEKKRGEGMKTKWGGDAGEGAGQ